MNTRAASRLLGASNDTSTHQNAQAVPRRKGLAAEVPGPGTGVGLNECTLPAYELSTYGHTLSCVYIYSF